jgi:hypothetical protein
MGRRIGRRMGRPRESTARHDWTTTMTELTQAERARRRRAGLQPFMAWLTASQALNKLVDISQQSLENDPDWQKRQEEKTLLTPENIIKEVLQNNRELNFLRRTEEEKEAIRGAIIAAVDEIVHAEITKIIKSSDI